MFIVSHEWMEPWRSFGFSSSHASGVSFRLAKQVCWACLGRLTFREVSWLAVGLGQPLRGTGLSFLWFLILQAGSHNGYAGFQERAETAKILEANAGNRYSITSQPSISQSKSQGQNMWNKLNCKGLKSRPLITHHCSETTPVSNSTSRSWQEIQPGPCELPIWLQGLVKGFASDLNKADLNQPQTFTKIIDKETLLPLRLLSPQHVRAAKSHHNATQEQTVYRRSQHRGKRSERWSEMNPDILGVPGSCCTWSCPLHPPTPQFPEARVAILEFPCLSQ